VVTLSSSLVKVAVGLPGAVRAVERGAEVEPLLVSGPPSSAVELRTQLTAGGDGALVQRVGILDLERPELAGSTALVYVIKGSATPADEHALRRADRQRIPIVCLILTDHPPDGRILPYVLATDVLRARALGPDVVDAIAKRLAVRVPDAAWALAGRLPALRVGAEHEIVRSTARRAATIGALSERVPGPDLPALSLLQAGMALRLASANGKAPRSVQALAAGVPLVVGLAGRAASRVLVGALPLPAGLVRGAVAYAGTRAVGEALRALGERRGEG
jgi:uncharacterized protein (DUF697 family)